MICFQLSGFRTFSLYQTCFDEQFKYLFFRNVVQLTFIVDIDMVDFMIFGHQVSDHSCATGFASCFGGNGQANFINAVPQVYSGVRFFFEGIDKFLQVSFQGRIFFNKFLEKLF